MQLETFPTESAALPCKVFKAFAAKLVVVIVLPEPEVNAVAADTAVAQVASLYRVTVALSDNVIVNVGVNVEPNTPGEIAVYVIEGAVVSMIKSFCPEMLLAPMIGRVRVALLPAASFTVPEFRASAAVFV